MLQNDLYLFDNQPFRTRNINKNRLDFFTIITNLIFNIPNDNDNKTDVKLGFPEVEGTKNEWTSQKRRIDESRLICISVLSLKYIHIVIRYVLSINENVINNL